MYNPPVVDNIPPMVYRVDSTFRRQRTFPIPSVSVLRSYTGESDCFVIDDERTTNLQKLSDIAKFEANWDGYGAKSFSSANALITKAKQIIFSLPVQNQPSLFPTARRSIQLEYRLQDNTYLEFELFEERIIVMLIPHNDYDKAQFRELGWENMEQVKRIINNFVNA